MTDPHRPAGRVFRRSTQAEPPVAVEASGSTIRDADGRDIHRCGGWGDRRQRRSRPGVGGCRDGRAGRSAGIRAWLGVHDGACRDVRRGSRCGPAGRRPGDLPGIGRVGGDRDRSQTRPRLPPCARRARAGRCDRPSRVISRQYPRRARPVRAAAAPPAIRTMAGSVPARLSGVPVSRGRDRGPRRPRRRHPRRGAGRDDPGDRAGPGRGVHRRADRRGHACGGRATRRLLAGDRRGLRRARRAPHRGRGHDRVRADRPLVRT